MSDDLPVLETAAAWEAAMDAVIAAYAESEWAKTYSADQRKTMAKSGAAMDDGSFPIADKEDVKNAIRLARTAAQRAHIIRRAKALGCSDLIPDTWSK